ncbi:MAG: hypothetical protein CML66_08945 [Rhodobacteraceae bacterium]|nr:hypothetical protein [Paracoccaceae bacterium]MAY46576.1 hypothetical protein [Paracoccaceae bacterium]
MILMHGTSRAARTSRDNWIAPAEAHGFLVVVPEFELWRFPAPDYAYGKLWSPDPPFARLAWAVSSSRLCLMGCAGSGGGDGAG